MCARGSKRLYFDMGTLARGRLRFPPESGDSEGAPWREGINLPSTHPSTKHSLASRASLATLAQALEGDLTRGVVGHETLDSPPQGPRNLRQESLAGGGRERGMKKHSLAMSPSEGENRSNRSIGVGNGVEGGL